MKYKDFFWQKILNIWSGWIDIIFSYKNWEVYWKIDVSTDLLTTGWASTSSKPEKLPFIRRKQNAQIGSSCTLVSSKQDLKSSNGPLSKSVRHPLHLSISNLFNSRKTKSLPASLFCSSVDDITLSDKKLTLRSFNFTFQKKQKDLGVC